MYLQAQKAKRIFWHKHIIFGYSEYTCLFLFVCFYIRVWLHWGFPDTSVGKESACNAGDPGSIPGSGRPAGEGIGHPLQYSWASLVAQLVKNLPAMRETWVQPLGLDRSPKEVKGYPLQYSGLENSMNCIAHGVTKSWTWLSNFHFLSFDCIGWNSFSDCQLRPTWSPNKNQCELLKRAWLISEAKYGWAWLVLGWETENSCVIDLS